MHTRSPYRPVTHLLSFLFMLCFFVCVMLFCLRSAFSISLVLFCLHCTLFFFELCTPCVRLALQFYSRVLSLTHFFLFGDVFPFVCIFSFFVCVSPFGPPDESVSY